MSNGIIVSEGIPEDARGITLVRRKTWITTYPNEKKGITKEDIEAAVNRRTVEEESNQRAERIRNGRNSQVWVAKDNETVIGFVEVQRRENKHRIEAIYILSEYQKQGIGSELMKRALAWLGNNKDIHFEVVAYNTKAIEFYKRFGFVENGVSHNEVAKLPSGKEMPEIEMIKKHQ